MNGVSRLDGAYDEDLLQSTQGSEANMVFTCYLFLSERGFPMRKVVNNCHLEYTMSLPDSLDYSFRRFLIDCWIRLVWSSLDRKCGCVPAVYKWTDNAVKAKTAALSQTPYSIFFTISMLTVSRTRNGA